MVLVMVVTGNTGGPACRGDINILLMSNRDLASPPKSYYACFSFVVINDLSPYGFSSIFMHS